MRRTLILVLVAGCGSVEPIGPPETSGDTWTTSSGPSDLSSSTGSGTDRGDSSTGTSSGSSTTGGTTVSSTGQVDGSSSTSNACPLGELGCGCLRGNECADGLACTSEICVPDIVCPEEQAGMETCQCTDGGGCDEGLTCASNLCVDAG